jgi:glutamate-1-semialdehyde 2,1-aminomutase
VAYGTQFPRSEALMRRAIDVMPGGNTRTTAHYPPFPLAIDRADGPFLWDADGNRLILLDQEEPGQDRPHPSRP